MTQSPPARLALEDGRVFHGRAFGARREVAAEVVFNTSHTGYQEVLTDPSYRGQAVVFTVPILGIYGVGDDADDQSGQAQAAAIVCREASPRASNYRSRRTLHEHLEAVGVPGIEQVDTRTLTKHLRDTGAKNGVVSTSDEPDEALVERARRAPSMAGLDLARVVTTAAPYRWDEGFRPDSSPWGPDEVAQAAPGARGRVVVVDFGVKRDILRHLVAQGLEVEVVPASTPADAILERGPDGVLLGSGPGDPAAVAYGIEAARALLGAAERDGLPVHGVCLGHQILSLAAGATTRKMLFGHRGANHPVRCARTGRVLITAHNHGFAVDPATLGRTGLEASYVSLFDGTVEGIRHTRLPVAAVQFHPEAGPGPHEAGAFFREFALAVSARRGAPEPAGAGRGAADGAGPAGQEGGA